MGRITNIPKIIVNEIIEFDEVFVCNDDVVVAAVDSSIFVFLPLTDGRYKVTINVKNRNAVILA